MCKQTLSPCKLTAAQHHRALSCLGRSQVADVVDGKQRLTTLQCFRKGRHPDGSVFKLQVGPLVLLRLLLAMLPQLEVPAWRYIFPTAPPCRV